MRLPGGRQAQPGVATGQSVLAWRLGYAEVFNNSLTCLPENNQRRHLPQSATERYYPSG